LGKDPSVPASGASRGTDGPLFGRSGGAYPGRCRTWRAQASEMERRKIECLGLSETRWSGKCDFVTDAGSTVIYSGTESRTESGVAVILDKERSRSLMGTNQPSEQPHPDSTIIRASEEVDPHPGLRTNKPGRRSRKGKLLHSCLQQVYQQVPKQDIVLLSGDFNAKIGKGAPIGKHALAAQNDNGERLVQFAQANDLVAENSMVQRHVRRMYFPNSFCCCCNLTYIHTYVCMYVCKVARLFTESISENVGL